MRTILMCAMAVVGLPSSTFAGDASPTVRLVVECSPETADAIQHLLKNTSAKVFRATAQAQRPGAKGAREKLVGQSPSAESVLPLWEAITDVVKSQRGSGVVVEKVAHSSRSLRMTVLATDHMGVMELRRRLNAVPALRKRMKSPSRGFEPGVMTKVGDRVRGELHLSLVPAPSATISGTHPVNGVPRIDAALLATMVEQAGLKMFRTGRESVVRTPGNASARTAMEIVFQKSTLDKLMKFVGIVTRANGMSPTAVRWQRAKGTDANPDGSQIEKSTVTIEAWNAH